jgi:uncharacterized protein YqgV (UPF0045/DUF77 family)
MVSVTARGIHTSEGEIMKIQAELSLYPLRTEELAPSIEDFRRALAQKGISIDPGPMSTVVSGESGALFRAISKGFERVAKQNEIVLIAKFSNACPLSRKEGKSNG